MKKKHMSSGVDGTVRQSSGTLLKDTDALFGALIENAFEIIIIIDLDGMICYVNPSIERVLGFKPAELIGVQFDSLVHPDDKSLAKNHLDEIRSAMPYDRTVLMEARFLRKNGGWSVLANILKALDTPSVTGIVINSRDITEYKRDETLRAGQSSVLEMVATDAPLHEVLNNLVNILESQSEDLICSILLLDEDGVHLRLGAGPSLPDEYVRSIDGSAIFGRKPVIVTDIQHDPKWVDYRDLATRYGFRTYWSVPILSSTHKVLGTFSMYYRDVRTPSSAELALADTATRIAGIAIERKISNDKIGHMAYHDALTGLPNRVLLQDRLNQAINHADRIQDGIAVLFIDLDQFKYVNDTLGHHVGDRLLQVVADRFQQCMRKDDTLARFGGDEFVVMLMAPADSHSAALVAQKILDALHEPVMINEHALHVSCSIGISLYPVDGDVAETLMSNADIAMYEAKGRGRGNYQYFTPDLNVVTQHRHSIAHQLRQALALGEFTLDYQCQVDMASGKIFAVEALIRWQQPQRGLVEPNDFISIAEDTGLILPIGEWVLREGCRQLKRWLDAGYADLTISINLSVRQILQPDLVSLVARILDETGLPAHALSLEITESMLMEPVTESLAVLTKLRNMGVQLSLDDFGTGYSSLSYLQRFSLNTLKIDRSFVRGIGHDQHDMAITNAIIAMAQTMHLQVIAEGVETPEQAAFLQEHGCRAAQGFYYGRPVAANVVSERLRSQ